MGASSALNVVQAVCPDWGNAAYRGCPAVL